jgi:hypothetical protein
MHLVEIVIGDIANVSQVVLLAFVALANVYLVVVIHKWRKMNIRGSQSKVAR